MPEVPRLSDEDKELLGTHASHIASALELAMLYSEMETRAETLGRQIAGEQRRFELVFKSVGDGIYATDTDLRVTMWNPSAERITGWQASEVIGKPCADFLSHEDENGNRLCNTPGCPLASALVADEPVPPKRADGHGADGRLLALSVSAAPIKDDRDKVTGLVEVFRDVSREVEIDQMKSDFISIVSHELRAPLTSIMGFVELLLTRDMPEETRRQWLEVVQTESRRLAAVIDDLLDLSRIESRRIALEPEPLDLAEIIAGRFAMLKPSLKKHRLRQHLPPGLPRVNADRLRLERILDNLLSNAVKYSPDGGEVTVSAHCEGDYVRVSVSDQGIGIPPDKLETIFQRFQQLDSFIRRKMGGAGLGLAIVKASVELHGGRIWAESQVGKGSTFHFTLPVAQERSSDIRK
jgi:PAS domain S-box-containing protein